MIILITRFTTTLLMGLALSACVANRAVRTQFEASNCVFDMKNCHLSIIERHPAFDLGFIEFTERGNLYSREASHKVLQLIKAQADTENGVAVFVFVHGWKHNAKSDDSNVVQFREFLYRAAENEIVGRRKVIGLYLGWRGNFTNIPVLRETTYWARKSVAEEIGAGGATEILSKLHQILSADYQDKNTASTPLKSAYVIIGHSFGGAIVLSALHDVLLKDIIEANSSLSPTADMCHDVQRFADAIILLNPAIEANKVILLKEAAARCRFGNTQAPLMHVLSSDGDSATQLFFPIGQFANLTRTLGPKKLVRRINGKEIILDERQLDRTTAGNLKQIRTAYLFYQHQQRKWALNHCKDSLDACGVQDLGQQKNHITVDHHDPLVFIKSDKNFIRNHNDVFGCYTQSFITSVIFESQRFDLSLRKGDDNLVSGTDTEGCNTNDFDFLSCFNNQLDAYECEQPSSG